MKKTLFLLLLTVASYGQTYQNPTFGTITSKTSQTVTSPVNLVTQDANGQQGKSSNVVNQINSSGNSGVLDFDGLEINADPTKFDIGEGIGYIYNSLTGVATKVVWPAQTAQTTPYLANSVATYVLKDSSGATELQNSYPTNEQFRTHIYLGKLAHTTFTTITVTVNDPSRSFSVAGDFHDFVNSIGSINIEGNAITPNGANLQINVSAGRTYREGANFMTNRNSPNITNEPAVNATTFRNKFRNGSGGWSAVNTTTVDPNNYDNGSGILQVVPNNKFTIRVVYRFGGSGVIHMDYGQAVYDNMEKADAGISALVASDPDTKGFASRIGWIIIQQGTTSLLDDTKYKFVAADLFGVRAATSAPTPNLQAGYDASVTPQIVTNTTGGAVAIRRGSAADTDNILVGQNGAGTNTFSVTGNGNVTGGTYNGYVPSLQNPIYYKGKDIEWFGDSYTIGSGASPISNRFTTIVSNALGATEINHGVAGTTMEKRVPIDYMASPNMVDNVVNIPTKTASKAMIVFAFGLNDMGQTATDYNVTNYKTDYQFVINNAISKGWLPSQILIIPAYYIGSAGYATYATITGNPAPTQARHLEFIQAAKEIALTNGTMYFDIYQDQLKNDTSLISGDNIHPTNAGHAYIANDILQYLGQDKLSITSDVTYSSGDGFISKINGNKLDNSFLYQTATGIGLATNSPNSTLQVHNTGSGSSIGITSNTTTAASGRGFEILSDSNMDVNLIQKENKELSFWTNNLKRAYFSNAGKLSIYGDLTFLNTAGLITFDPSSGGSGGILFKRTATNYWQFSDGAGDGSLNINIYNYTRSAIDLSINNSTGVIKIPNLAGTGERVVSANTSGELVISSTPTAPTATAGTNTTQIATTAFVQAATGGYLKYVALLTQTGTGAPTATVLENTLGGTLVWTRSSTGIYIGTLSGVFTNNKTSVSITNGSSGAKIIGAYSDTTSTITIGTVNAATSASEDDVLFKATIEIRIYP